MFLDGPDGIENSASDNPVDVCWSDVVRFVTFEV